MEPFIPPVNVLVEGDPDEVVARRILQHVGLAFGTPYGKQGKNDLLRRISNYNQAARHAPWLALADLDRDAECAPPFIQRILPHPAGGMRFRVAVRTVEAWLMADAERLAAFLDIPVHQVPRNPEAELWPKIAMVDLARHSRKREIREDMVPRQESGARIGPGYNGRLSEFVLSAEHLWRPDVAAEHSDSLRRCLEALDTLKSWRPN